MGSPKNCPNCGRFFVESKDRPVCEKCTEAAEEGKGTIFGFTPKEWKEIVDSVDWNANPADRYIF